MGHPTLAFNERQVQSVTSSLHMVKNELEEAMRIGACFSDETQWQGHQQVHCFSSRSEISAGHGNQSEDGTGGNTNGALISDYDFVTCTAGRCKESESGGLFTQGVLAL